MVSQFTLCPWIRVSECSFDASYYANIHNILPNLTIHCIFPENYLGEKSVAFHYAKVCKKYGIKIMNRYNFSGSKSQNNIDLVLSLDENSLQNSSRKLRKKYNKISGEELQNNSAKYTYMFSHSIVNMQHQKNKDLWIKEKKFKKLLQVGKNCYFPGISVYGAETGCYFTVPRTILEKSNLEDASLFFCGGTWDRRYSKCLSLLDLKDFFNWYGPTRELSTKASHKGYSLDIIESIKKHKIALLLHGKRHRENEEPTLRIFEAASAGAVIISDNHPFIVKNFGDSVLYVNHNDSEEKIAQDIINHYEWIKSHQAEALELAERAHSIFMERFSLEDQLLKLIKIHQETLILEGFQPLLPRGPFKHIYYKSDFKLLNNLLTILMPQHFIVRNFTKSTIQGLLLLSFIKKESLNSETISLPKGIVYKDGQQEKQTLDITQEMLHEEIYLNFNVQSKATIPSGRLKEYRFDNNLYVTGLHEQAGVFAYLLEWDQRKGFILSLIDDSLLNKNK